MTTQITKIERRFSVEKLESSLFKICSLIAEERLKNNLSIYGSTIRISNGPQRSKTITLMVRTEHGLIANNSDFLTLKAKKEYGACLAKP